MDNHYQLTDKEFELQFQNATLNPSLFNHEAHIRLAWIHITKYGTDKALINVDDQLFNYVVSLGAKDKYNKTVTMAAVKAVSHFIGKAKSTTFKDFIEEFPRLKHNFKDLLAQHYDMDIFNLNIAKSSYLKPKLLPFN